MAGTLPAVLVVAGFVQVGAQGTQPWPTAPQERGLVSGGMAVSPFFEGWYENPDGSYTLSFGYFNRNRDESLTLPVGPDNFIEPAEYDGRQPTFFAPGRDTGVFTVTVPAEFGPSGGRVVWTLRSDRTTPHSVPGRVGVEAYRLFHGPMAMGSFAPVLKLSAGGPELWGPMTVAGDARERSTWSSGRSPTGSVENPLTLSATVGEPLTLTVWVADRLAPGAERESVQAGVTWFTHQGPTAAVFAETEPEPDPMAGGRASTTVTFGEPGSYVLRVRADNFNPVDSSPGDQCCWTNGYVRVTVGP